MATAIDGLKPELVWKRFYEISRVPRPSKHEDKIREHIRNFAKERELEFKEDEVGTILIKVPATKGFEKAPLVILQGHVDMVCEKNKNTVHDFENDPLKLIRTGDWIKADGTTLGADNGIGVAAALATVDDNSFQHGPLELLCTVDEETGLTGANNLQPGFIEGNILLNLDCEEDGAFYVGCCGGQDSMGAFRIEYENRNKKFTPFKILLGGLLGGHSGMEINTGRANAIKQLARLLSRFNIEYQITGFNGGSKRNAIPREAEVIVLFDKSDTVRVKSIINEFIEDYLKEYKKNDGGLVIDLQNYELKDEKVYSTDFRNKIINTLLAMQHGVISMSPDIEGLVETSTNLATVTIEEDILKIGTSQRSSIESAKHFVTDSVKAVFELAGAEEIVISDGYPGWQPDMQSKLLKTSMGVFKKLYNKEPEVKAIHAGLECGIFAGKYPGLDMIAFGPTIQGAHSPDERVNINDVGKFYDLLKGILIEIAGK